MSVDKLQGLKESVQLELHEGLLPFWQTQVIDYQNGGFIGRMASDRSIDRRAVKGLILNTRLLWTYSAIYRYAREDSFKTLARRAFDYLVDKFIDPEFGGAYWFLDAQGTPVDVKKRIYGQAFFIYALAEFYRMTEEKHALDLACRLYEVIEGNALDRNYGGYFETFERNWSVTEELRLSPVDMNEKKSMNTHLHLLEAYTNLYRVWKTKQLEQKIVDLLKLFLGHIINQQTWHFHLFFDEQWTPKSERISFGHDIEGSWLLVEAATVIQAELLARVRDVSLDMARRVLKEGVDRDGGLLYEADPSGIIDADKHWWPQAEAVVGFLHAYQLSGDEGFIRAAIKTWSFIEKHIIDKKNGDWFWRVSKERKPYKDDPKVSEWKSAYHSCRACLEIIDRIDQITATEKVEM
ncbi:AGE family epimerase/isomerase [candidate division KSB1 bacterium]|nr:AGE family epimerase/isomerase [candidate division KSB1 bacterium]RQW09421.1 MAG: N-acyl-D-glucosamine 2-epimerase [candidate division KSB1 bacterium]